MTDGRTGRTPASVAGRPAVRTVLGGRRESTHAAAWIPEYSGERLRLPRRGRGSVAGFGRRLIAFTLDLLLAVALAYGLLGIRVLTLPIFVAEVLLFTALFGGSFGQRVVRIRLIGVNSPLRFRRVLLRTIMLILLVPALVRYRDGRGMHDDAANVVLVRG